MPSRRRTVPARSVLTFALFAAFVALALGAGADPLAAQISVESYRGSHCHPSNFNGETDDWAYEGNRLVNNGSSSWDVLVASCPVNAKPTQSASNSRLGEVRVYVDGATFSNGWCNVIDWTGVRRSMRVSATNPEYFGWVAPWNSGITSKDIVVECLVLADWAMEKIEVVWYWAGNL